MKPGEHKPKKLAISLLCIAALVGVVASWRASVVLSSPEIRFGVVARGVALPDRRAEIVFTAMNTFYSPAEIVQRARAGQLTATYHQLGPDRCSVVVRESDILATESTAILRRIASGWQLENGSMTSHITTECPPEPPAFFNSSTFPLPTPPSLDVTKINRDSTRLP